MTAGEQTWIVHAGLPEGEAPLIGQSLGQETRGLVMTRSATPQDNLGCSSSGWPFLTGVDLSVFGIIANHATAERGISARVSGAGFDPQSQHFFLKRCGFDLKMGAV